MEDDKKCEVQPFFKIPFQMFFGWIVQNKT